MYSEHQLFAEYCYSMHTTARSASDADCLSRSANIEIPLHPNVLMIDFVMTLEKLNMENPSRYSKSRLALDKIHMQTPEFPHPTYMSHQIFSPLTHSLISSTSSSSSSSSLILIKRKGKRLPAYMQQSCLSQCSTP